LGGESGERARRRRERGCGEEGGVVVFGLGEGRGEGNRLNRKGLAGGRDTHTHTQQAQAAAPGERGERKEKTKG